MPKVVKGGFLVVHDYHTREANRYPFPGVDAAVNATLLNKWGLVALVDTIVVFRKP
jgi:hypothetical protein